MKCVHQTSESQQVIEHVKSKFCQVRKKMIFQNTDNKGQISNSKAWVDWLDSKLKWVPKRYELKCERLKY